MIRFPWNKKKSNDGGHAGKASALAALQQFGYKPLQLPHRGKPSLLSESQLNDNQQYYASELPARLAAIRALLKSNSVLWPDDMTGLDYKPLVTNTRNWAKNTWPALRQAIESEDIRKLWLEGERDGHCIGLSLVTDVALLLGEYIIANRTTLHWGIDRDQQNRLDGMTSANRWVLLGDWLPEPSTRVVVDVEHTVLTLFVEPEDSSERLFNTWENLVRDCLSGGFEGVALVK